MSDWRCPCDDGNCPGKTMALHPAVQALYERCIEAGHTVTSGMRCPTHNAKVGGEAGSKHVVGGALDIIPRNRYLFVTGLLVEEKWRIITYPHSTHVHVQVADEARLYVKTKDGYARAL